MANKKLSTFEREMKNSAFKKKFVKGYKKFLFSELLISMMEGDSSSVRKLAKLVGVSPTIVQNIRSGKQKDAKLSNFISLFNAFGYKLILEKDDERIEVHEEKIKKEHNIVFSHIR